MRNFFIYLAGLLMGVGAILMFLGVRNGAQTLVLWGCIAILASYIACFLSGFYQGWSFGHRLERTVYREK